MSTDPTENLYFIDRLTDPEAWDAAWAALKAEGWLVPADPPCPACNRGECWEYMGSYPDTKDGNPGIAHQFRHRNYPGLNIRIYSTVFTRS